MSLHLDMPGFVSHRYIRPGVVESRTYQQRVLAKAFECNTLLVAPTAIGKTVVAILLSAHRLDRFPDSRILVLAPTKPLVSQHCETFRRMINLDPNSFVVLTGDVPPSERSKLWGSGRIIFATPQVVENDLVSARLNLGNFSLLVFDEAHRAVGGYAYTFIAEKYREQASNPLVFAMTASPGSEVERIKKVAEVLGLEHVEVLTEKDWDVAPYLGGVFVEWRHVELPSYIVEMKKLLWEMLKQYLMELRKHGYVKGDTSKIGKKQLLELQSCLQADLERGRGLDRVYGAMTARAAAFKIQHALELLETQSLKTLKTYLDGLKLKSGTRGASRAIKKIVSDPKFVKLCFLVEKHEKEEHPKLREAATLVREQLEADRGSKVIVFTHYRKTGESLVQKLGGLPGVRPALMVGQTHREDQKGFSQREQVETLEKFRRGEYNTLVATSVAEEGLDIPNVDLVIFYEPVPSEIRTIQRRGRTGRRRDKPGRVVALIAKGTRDEAYYWSSKHKEDRMRGILRGMRKELVSGLGLGEQPGDGAQMTLSRFVAGDQVVVYVDHREMGSGVVKELSRLGVRVVSEQLVVADYLLSDRVGVERKTFDDFLGSIVDKRLFSQVVRLVDAYEAPLLVLEGEGSLFDRRGLHPNAVRGALASLAVDYRIPVLVSRSPRETAELLVAIARREQKEEKREVGIRGKPRLMSISEQQRFIVESLPGVGPLLAKSLLKKFGTVEKVMTAEEKELMEAEKIGEKTARMIRKVLTTKYVDQE